MKHEKRCPTCHQLHVIYRQTFRSNMLEPLKLLALNPPMTAQELAACFERENPRLAIEITKRFPAICYWGLIRKCDNNRYVVTPSGHSAIQGMVTIPEYVWTLNGEPVAVPEGEKPAPRVHLWEMEPRDFSDRRKHVEQAAQMSFPVSA